jgi:hypothetical protein
VVVATVDTQPPTPPSSVRGRFSNGTLILSWQPATDDVGVDHYDLYRNDTRIARVPENEQSTSTRAFSPTGKNIFTLRATDAAGNVSAPSSSVTVVHVVRPEAAPSQIPSWAWKLIVWQQSGQHDPRPGTPKNLPNWYPAWKAWRLQPFELAD